VGHPGVSVPDLATLLREAIHNARFRRFYSAQAIIGLEEDFMVKANIMMPEGFENNLYSWMLNFQYLNDEYAERYKNSRELPNDGDLFVYADPYWTHPDYPLGLAFFSPEQNCAAILGMRYFGEFKKGTLTLAWGAAARNGYASCHGGLKRYELKDGSGRKYVLAVFGLSGSGKSTITHAKHKDKYNVTVLHDDAVIINVKEKYAIALEPAYFDKMQDYPIGCPDNKYLLSLQNCGVTRDENGKLMVVSEDIRNGNGRAVKSRFWTPNRIDRIDEPLNAICWLMKDPAAGGEAHGAVAGLGYGLDACHETYLRGTPRPRSRSRRAGDRELREPLPHLPVGDGLHPLPHSLRGRRGLLYPQHGLFYGQEGRKEHDAFNSRSYRRE